MQEKKNSTCYVVGVIYGCACCYSFEYRKMKKSRGREREREVPLRIDILSLMEGESCVEVCLYCTQNYLTFVDQMYITIPKS